MWVRTQLKIGWGDLLAGLRAGLFPPNRDEELQKVESFFTGHDDAIATFSVRSGFDLLLQALDLKPGDEIIFSALNVRVMVRVVNESGYIAVPVDVDIETMGPRLDKLEAAITPRSRVFVAAHLFGSRVDLGPAFDLAKSKGLIVVEDCAQTFNGRDYLGHPRADIVMYSFGPIKTSTALGGGILRVKHQPLRDKMRQVQAAYPIQPNSAQLVRVFKFMALKAVTAPVILGSICKIFTLRGQDYEDALANWVRDVAPLNTLARMRVQCSAALLWMMHRRLARYRPADIAQREQKGRRFSALIGNALKLPAQHNRHHDYWVFPLLVKEPKRLIRALRREGFDAADLPRSQHIAAPPDRPQLEPNTAAAVMRDIVIVPCYASMPDSEIERQAQIVKKFAAEVQSS